MSAAAAPRRILFLCFFVSGGCSLLYQVVWLRLAFAALGVVTPVLSVVVSSFMAGIFLGSWGAARWVGVWSRRGRSAIWLYAAAELAIGVGALAVPVLIDLGSVLLLPSGESDSWLYLSASALVVVVAMAPWCLCMGATFPLAMAFLRGYEGAERSSFSFLYLANVLGAMFGTLATTAVFVELFGFRNTLLAGASGNLLAASGAVWLGLRGRRSGAPTAADPEVEGGEAAKLSSGGGSATALLFATGLCSMGAEVVWVRAFTPVLGTQVYSFGLLLFVYLLATWIGSAVYRLQLRRARSVPVSTLVALVASASLLPIVLNDPALGLRAAGALLSIVPLCAVLGYLTPKLIDELSGGDPRRAGRAYAANVLGCIVGPLVASYLLLPFVGVRAALALFAAPFVAITLRDLARRQPGGAWRQVRGAVLVGLGALAAVSGSYEEGTEARGGRREVRRDNTATVISSGSGMDKRLLVNGIGMTRLTTVTKVMSHLPLASLDLVPRSGLVICLGMGTSWRSMLRWDIDATVVELIPSVELAFPYYFDDAHELLALTRGRIVIDDGRRFLRRTAERYDVIVVDPPPPISAAASSLLYSEEFYRLARERLTPRGVLQQWFPAVQGSTLRAAALSLRSSFPYLRAFRSLEGSGVHFLASENPLARRSAAELESRMPPGAVVDLEEWSGAESADALLATVLRGEIDVDELIGESKSRITDDRPFNEYYLMRYARWRLGR